MKKMSSVSVIGLGYVGLPTAVLAAQCGYDVTGYDIDFNKLEKIKNGDPTIVEPEIFQRLNEVLLTEKLKISSKLQPSDCFLISVPTPLKNDKKSDMSAVYDAGEKIAAVLKQGDLVILESTVKVGTTMKLAKILEDKYGLKLGINFYVAYCPERVLPGNTFKELIENNRVIGATCLGAAELSKDFYSKFVKGKLEFADDKTAELVKLIENSSRDVQIAFANQVDEMAKEIGIDSYNVIRIANKHPRVNILNPTCGVGGHCIAVDPWFLIESFPKNTKLLQISRSINDKKPGAIISDVLNKAEEFKQLNNRKPIITALGIAFKPDVDDVRESPALKIANELNQKDNLDFYVYDPFIDKKNFNNNNLKTFDKLNDAIKKADIILFLVKHSLFFQIKEKEFFGKQLIDTCGLMQCFSQKNKMFLQDAIKVSSESKQTFTF